MTGHSTKTAGVIAGLGPAATVDFLAKVLAATPAKSDQEHIRMLIDHNPLIPDRHDALAGKTASLGPLLAAMASNLERAGADFLVMVCNTAHAYTDDIRAAITIPFISIVDVTVEALSGYKAKKVGLMVAEGCLRSGIYQRRLERAGYRPAIWNRDEMDIFMSLLYRIKAGDSTAEIGLKLVALAESLARDGAEILIAGCTEVPLFLAAEDSPLPLLSSTDLLVARTVEVALKG